MKTLDPTFSRALLRWYSRHKRDLPWRRTRDPYAIWISEIMLQQTTVAAVIPKFHSWIHRFPNIETLSRARRQTVLKMWEGLGYYARARNLHNAAKMITRQYQGKVPDDLRKLQCLPGFGPYTAAAVSSIAYNRRNPLIDANVRRVMMRILAFTGEIDRKTDRHIFILLSKLIPRSAGNFNQALMELGALLCGKIPQCLQCPVRSWCRAYEQDIQAAIPPRKIRPLTRIRAAVALIQRQDGKWLIQQRSGKGLLAELWEFPGGKLEKGETSQQAVVREVREEAGAEICPCALYMKTHHFYLNYRVHLDAWRCRLLNNPPKKSNQRWVSLLAISRYPMPSGSVKIVERMLRDKELPKKGIAKK